MTKTYGRRGKRNTRLRALYAPRKAEMTDKTAKRTKKPKGREYCDVPGTSCYYDENDVCINCERKKGWRQTK